jgi:hypothetical protein
VPTYSVGASLKVFSLRTTDFSSEMGEVKHYISFFPLLKERVSVGRVRCFFAYFFASKQKSKWGAGLAPIKEIDYIVPVTYILFLILTNVIFYCFKDVKLKAFKNIKKMLD